MENEGGKDLSKLSERSKETERDQQGPLKKKYAKELRGHERKKIKTTFEDHLLPIWQEKEKQDGS